MCHRQHPCLISLSLTIILRMPISLLGGLTLPAPAEISLLAETAAAFVVTSLMLSALLKEMGHYATPNHAL